jgi:hypothetical protein
VFFLDCIWNIANGLFCLHAAFFQTYLLLVPKCRLFLVIFLVPYSLLLGYNPQLGYKNAIDPLLLNYRPSHGVVGYSEWFNLFLNRQQ